MGPDGLTPLPSRRREHYIDCRFCGHRNKRTARVCEVCGARITFADTTRAYVEPVARRFGWVVLLALPVGLVCVVALSVIAGGLGYGDAVRPFVNKILLGFGALALLVVMTGVLVLAYHRKPKIK